MRGSSVRGTLIRRASARRRGRTAKGFPPAHAMIVGEAVFGRIVWAKQIEMSQEALWWWVWAIEGKGPTPADGVPQPTATMEEVTRWHMGRASGTQEEEAARLGVSKRTLLSWRHKLGMDIASPALPAKTQQEITRLAMETDWSPYRIWKEMTGKASERTVRKIVRRVRAEPAEVGGDGQG